MVPIAIVLGLSIAAGIMGRAGGTSAGTAWRDYGVSACIVLILALLGSQTGAWAWMSLIPTMGLTCGALTTYRYWLPKPTDYTPAFYALHSFMISLAAIFFAWATGHWFWFGVRCAINAILVGFISHTFRKSDNLNEFLRYAAITATTPLLLI